MIKEALDTVSSEHYFIGILVKDYSFALNLCNTIGFKGDYLESPTSRAIWQASEALFSKGICVDVASLVEYLEAFVKHIDSASVSSYMMNAMNLAKDPHNLIYHISVIKEKHKRNKTISILNDGTARLNSHDDIDDVSSWIRHSLTCLDRELSQSLETKDDKRNRILSRFNGIRSSGTSGIESRYTELQQLLGSYRAGKITIIAARPKMGKSTLALNEAVYSGYWKDIPTAIFSIEMDHDELIEKAASDLTEMDNAKLALGEYSPKEIDRFMEDGVDRLMDSHLHIIDSPSQTVESICSKTRQLVAEHGVKFVIIDYLQIISSTPGSKFQNRTYEIGHMTNQLRILAKETGVSLVLLSQITRPVKGIVQDDPYKLPMPTMNDLRDSGAIEQDAYAIVIIGPTQKPCPAPSWFNIVPMCLRVEANRGGATGDFEAWFNKPNNKFMTQGDYDAYRSSYFTTKTQQQITTP